MIQGIRLAILRAMGINVRKYFLFLAIGIVVLFTVKLAADSLTFTTYYPAPYGVYTNLRSTQDAYFAYNSGNVGIGTKTPGGKLDIEGTGNVIFNTNGNVGIGTTSPIALLTVSKAAGATGNNTLLSLLNPSWANWDFKIDGTASYGLQPGSLLIMPGVGNTDFGIGSQVVPMAFVIKNSGNVGIWTASPQAALDVASTTSGFLPPRMTTAQRNAIGSQSEGLQIYNITTHQLEYWNGTSWGSSTGAIGNFSFKVPGDPYAHSYMGTGKYVSSQGKFSGSVICDPNVYDASCGIMGNYWCGSSASCVGYMTGGDSTHNYAVGVAGLPISNVTQNW